MKHVKLFEAWNKDYFNKIGPKYKNPYNWTPSEIEDLKNLGAEEIKDYTCVFNEPNGLVIKVTNRKDPGPSRYFAQSNRKALSTMGHTNRAIGEDWFKFLNNLNILIEKDGIMMHDISQDNKIESQEKEISDLKNMFVKIKRNSKPYRKN